MKFNKLRPFSTNKEWERFYDLVKHVRDVCSFPFCITEFSIFILGIL